MFELTKISPVKKAKLHRTIIDHIGKTIDIEYEVGYLEDTNFRPIGVDKLFLQDQEEKRDKKTGKITQEAKSDYSDYMKKLETETDIEKIDMDTLREKGVAK